MGFMYSKPIDLMIRNLAVCPPQIRPSIELNPEKKAEDALTTAYLRIIGINNDFKKGNFDATERQHKLDEMEKIIASIMVKV